MTPNSYPDDDPREVYDREQEQAELSERAILVKLLASLHLVHEAALEASNASGDIYGGLGSLALSIERPRNVEEGRFNPLVAPCSFSEMQSIPRADTIASFGFEKVMVRFPELQGEDFGVFDPGTVVVPNDVLVELFVKDGENHRYLVNDHGVFGYADAESLHFDDSEMMDPSLIAAGEKPNVFKVEPEHPFIPYMTPRTLHQLLLDEGGFRTLDRH